MAGTLIAISHLASVRTQFFPQDTPGIPPVAVEVQTTDADLIGDFNRGMGEWIYPVGSVEAVFQVLERPAPWPVIGFNTDDSARTVAVDAWRALHGVVGDYLDDAMASITVPVLGSAPDHFQQWSEMLHSPGLSGLALILGSSTLADQPHSPAILVLMFVGYTVYIRVLDPVLRAFGEIAEERIKGRRRPPPEDG
jgi:hypothetical protein